MSAKAVVDVYRVEDPGTHVGPYQHDYCDLRQMFIAHSDWTHPGVEGDGKLDPDKIDDRVFGFESMGAFTKWFSGWLDVLDRCGFVLNHYRAPRTSVMFGRAQLVFDREKATLVETTKLTEVPECTA